MTTQRIGWAGGPDAIAFDLDGTLVDSLPIVLECYRLAIVELGGRDRSPDEILASFSIGPASVMLAELIGRPVGTEAVACSESHLAVRASGISVYEGIVPTLSALHPHVPLGVLTAADTSAADIVLRSVGLRPFFDVVIGGDRVRPKPDPHGLLLACDALGVAPSHAAYVGDGPADMATARAAGVLALAAGWGHQYSPDREADLVLADPRELLDVTSGARRLASDRDREVGR